MGVIEETRQVIQDFLAPELREIRTRLDAMEETNRVRFESLIHRLESQDRRIEANEEANRARFESIVQRLDAIQLSFAFDKRLSDLEAERHRPA